MSTETKNSIQSEGYTFSNDVLSDTDFTTGTNCPEYECAMRMSQKKKNLKITMQCNHSILRVTQPQCSMKKL